VSILIDVKVSRCYNLIKEVVLKKYLAIKFGGGK